MGQFNFLQPPEGRGVQISCPRKWILCSRYLDLKYVLRFVLSTKSMVNRTGAINRSWMDNVSKKGTTVCFYWNLYCFKKQTKISIGPVIVIKLKVLFLTETNKSQNNDTEITYAYYNDRLHTFYG